MNKEELEKMFNDKFGELYSHTKKTKIVGTYNHNLGRYVIANEKTTSYKKKSNEVKQFIFNEIIPEVLNNVIGEEGISTIDDIEDIARARGYNRKRDGFKEKAKKLYGITL